MNKVFVIGGANVDICGASINELQMFDSNPGVITTSFGGVGRNIAENLARLGADVYFITIFSNDFNGKQLKGYCEQVGIDCSLSKVIENTRTSVYLALLNEKKDMQIAMSDMDILNYMNEEILGNVLSRITKDDVLVIDTNLKKELIKYIMENTEARIVMDPISVAKAVKIQDCLDAITIFKPNMYESKIYTSIDIVDKQTAIESLDYYIDAGVNEILISLSEKGVLAANKDEKIWVEHKVVDIVNATGGGDSFLAAYLWARMNGRNLEEAVSFAISSAVCTISSIDTVNPNLCVKLIEETEKQLEIKRINL